MTPKLGIDIGGVIRRQLWEGSRWPKVFFPEACENVSKLVEDFGSANVFIVSARSFADQVPTTGWLEVNGFFAQTRMDPENIHYCISRSEKTPICRMLEITHFVDDRLTVLGHMKDCVPYRFLFKAHKEEISAYPHLLEGVIRVPDWRRAYSAISATLKG